MEIFTLEGLNRVVLNGERLSVLLRRAADEIELASDRGYDDFAVQGSGRELDGAVLITYGFSRGYMKIDED